MVVVDVAVAVVVLQYSASFFSPFFFVFLPRGETHLAAIRTRQNTKKISLKKRKVFILLITTKK